MVHLVVAKKASQRRTNCTVACNSLLHASFLNANYGGAEIGAKPKKNHKGLSQD
jgi:hypothetical protein